MHVFLVLLVIHGLSEWCTQIVSSDKDSSSTLIIIEL